MEAAARWFSWTSWWKKMSSAFVSAASTKGIKPSDPTWDNCSSSPLFSSSSRPSFQ